MGNDEFHLENQPKETHTDWRHALAIQRRGEIIEFTHWTITDLDEQPSNQVDDVLLYLRAKGKAQSEKDKLAEASRSQGPKRRPR